MVDAVIAGYARTPFTFARKGALKDARPDDLAALALKALIERSRLDPALIEDVLMGCAYPEAAQIRCYEYTVDDEYPREAVLLVRSDGKWTPDDKRPG